MASRAFCPWPVSKLISRGSRFANRWPKLTEPLFVDLPNDVAFHEVADTDATDGDSLLGLATSLQWNVVPVFGYRWRDVIDETTG